MQDESKFKFINVIHKRVTNCIAPHASPLIF